MGQALQRIVPESDDMVNYDLDANFSPLSASVMRHRDGLANAAAVGGEGMGGMATRRESEFDDARSVYSMADDDQVVTTHAFLENPGLSKGFVNPSTKKELMRSVAQLADTFETFEFMLDTCVASVSTFGVGFSDDHRHQILKLTAPMDKLLKEEEYRRGLIVNSMLTLSQIIHMAAAQVMPALVAIQHVDAGETGRFKKQLAHRGRAGSFIGPRDSGASSVGDNDAFGGNRSSGTATVTIFQRDLNIKYRRGGAMPPATPLEYDTSNGASGFSPANSVSARRGDGAVGHEASHSGHAMVSIPGPSPSLSAESPNADPAAVAFFKRLSGSSIDAFKTKTKAKVIPNWNLRSSEEPEKAVEWLNGGNGYFHFVCSPLTACNNEDLTVIQNFVNITNFEDEMRDNNCPVVDVFDEEQKPLYQIIGVKAVYLLPGVDISSITRGLMATQEYNKACQPGDCKFFDCETPYTFRQTKCVVKFVYTITVQFLVGEVTDPAVLEQYVNIEGIRPSKIIFLERTKRNVSKTDSTAKVRSILFYYPVTDGVYVSHHTVVMSTSIPGLVAKVVNNFGSQGAAESGETADLTRRFLLKKFGDTRKN